MRVLNIYADNLLPKPVANRLLHIAFSFVRHIANVPKSFGAIRLRTFESRSISLSGESFSVMWMAQIISLARFWVPWRRKRPIGGCTRMAGDLSEDEANDWVDWDTDNCDANDCVDVDWREVLDKFDGVSLKFVKIILRLCLCHFFLSLFACCLRISIPFDTKFSSTLHHTQFKTWESLLGRLHHSEITSELQSLWSSHWSPTSSGNRIRLNDSLGK